MDDIKFAGGLAVKIGVNRYEMALPDYFTRTSGPSQEEIVGIGVVTAVFDIVGPDLAQG